MSGVWYELSSSKFKQRGRAANYGERAEELRAAAENFHDPVCREKLFNLADDYESMAQAARKIAEARGRDDE